MKTFNIGPLYTVENNVKVEYRYKLISFSNNDCDYDVRRIVGKETENRHFRVLHDEIKFCREMPTIMWDLAGMNAKGLFLVTLQINKKNKKDVRIIEGCNIYNYKNIGINRIFRWGDDNNYLYMITWQKSTDNDVTAQNRKDMNKAFKFYNNLMKLIQVKKPRRKEIRA